MDFVQFLEDRGFKHHGIKGMRWGVRRDDPSAGLGPSADVARARAAATKVTRKGGTDALDNHELQALVNRMNLEQQYGNLTAKSNTTIVSSGRRWLGKAAGEIASNQAKGVVNMVLKNQIKKALKAKGLA